MVVPLVRVAVQHHAPANMLDAELLYRATPFRIDALLIGGLSALWYRGAERKTMLRSAHWILWLCTSVVIIYIALAVHDPKDYVYPAWRLTWGLSFIDVYAAAILLVALQSGSLVNRVFNLAPLRWLGRVSYGAYVFHDIYHHAIAERVHAMIGPGHEAADDALTAISAFAITLVLAAVSFYFFESPFLKLKRRWASSEIDTRTRLTN